MNFRAIPAIPGAASLKPASREWVQHEPALFPRHPGRGLTEGGGVVGVLEC